MLDADEVLVPLTVVVNVELGTKLETQAWGVCLVSSTTTSFNDSKEPLGMLVSPGFAQKQYSINL